MLLAVAWSPEIILVGHKSFTQSVTDRYCFSDRSENTVGPVKYVFGQQCQQYSQSDAPSTVKYSRLGRLAMAVISESSIVVRLSMVLKVDSEVSQQSVNLKLVSHSVNQSVDQKSVGQLVILENILNCITLTFRSELI